MLSEIKKSLRQRLSLPLPGEEAQFKMANAERRLNLVRFKIPENPRKSAVMILLYEKENTLQFPLIIRPIYDGIHSGQVSLPGGSFDPNDTDLQETAIRETEEETGIFKKNISVVGKLSNLYIPPSNFLVTPFVGVHSGIPEFNPDSVEVARIVEMEVEKIMDEKLIKEKTMKFSNGVSMLTPYFDIDGLTIWGATAMILSEFKSVLYETGF
jgi:8-oxo-dGTP pyrophosphatase MutT (NUDIX family)